MLWTTFLFVSLTVIFTIYSRRVRKITGRIFHISQSMLRRFITAIHRALRGIMLGIVLVALAQGFLAASPLLWQASTSLPSGDYGRHQ